MTDIQRHLSTLTDAVGAANQIARANVAAIERLTTAALFAVVFIAALYIVKGN